MTKSIADQEKNAWFALADAESCRLLCCSLTRQGKNHVDEFDAFENTLPEQEHVRPMTNAGTSHHDENKERRFAGEIIAWLQVKAAEHTIDRLVIYAPPRMLGLLRVVPLGSLKGHLEELKGDLMRLNVGQLADHPMIHERMSPHFSDERVAFDTAAS